MKFNFNPLKIGLSLLLVAFMALPSAAEVTLARVFSSNMVLQQGRDIPVWGWASPGEKIRVTFKGTTARVKTMKNGSWNVTLPASDYGGPFTMEIKGKNTIVLENVMVGEVWICSGQSNMEFPVSRSNDATNEISHAGFPDIRLFTVPRAIRQYPSGNIENGQWMVCSPETVPGFSAVAYFFARELYNDLKVPVGVIHTSWGATTAETWTSAQTIRNNPDLKDRLAELLILDSDSFMNNVKKPNMYPTLLFNGMINPLVPYGIRGAIWYQGESNAARARQYEKIFPDLINDWRRHWGLGDFPFLFVSLANFREPCSAPCESAWAELREVQTRTLRIPNTGMAVAIDIGKADDIHPGNKQDVAKRLALNALKIAYNKNVVYSGPIYQSMEIKDGMAHIRFNHVADGLVAKDKYGYVKGFTVAGEDRVFHWARARITDANTVVVFCDVVKNPVAVRYGWADNPDDLNLYNSAGLPANPFRTDDWPGITQ